MAPKIDNETEFSWEDRPSPLRQSNARSRTKKAVALAERITVRPNMYVLMNTVYLNTREREDGLDRLKSSIVSDFPNRRKVKAKGNV